MRKGRDREEKKNGKKGEKIMRFILTINVVPSRPTEHQTIGTLHARAKNREHTNTQKYVMSCCATKNKKIIRELRQT